MSADTFTAPTASRRELRAPARLEPMRRLAQRVRLTRTTALVSLIALAAVSVGLRTTALHFYYWIDEGISVGIASHSLGHIPTLMRQDGSPPLYYLILHVWMSWRGHSEVATHELSLLFALLTIPAAYWAGASLFGRRTGLTCAALAAGVPYLNVYAQETRMYAFVALLSILVAAGFVHGFVRRDRRYLPLFSLSLAACLYSHNWGLFLGLAAGGAFLWCLYAQREDRRALLRDGALAFGAVALLFLPWLPTLLYQSGHTGAPWDLPPVFWSLTTSGYFIAGGRGAAVALLLAGGAGLLTLRETRPRAADGLAASSNGTGSLTSRRHAWLAAQALIGLSLGTLLIAFVYSKISPAWAPRYFAVIIGPLVLLFGLGLARAGRFGLVALALVGGFWILDPKPHLLPSKSNVALVAAQVRHHLGTDPLVLSTQPEQVPTLAFYLPGVHRFGTPLGPVADPRVVDWRDALTRLKHSSVHSVLGPMVATLRPGQRVLLVTPVNFPKVPLWMKLIDRATNRWTYFLAHDHALRRLHGSNAKWYDAGVAVQGYLYERR